MGLYSEDSPVLAPIAAGSQLLACVHRKTQTFVTIQGPCGQGHTMSLAEAKKLRDWLIANVADEKFDSQ
jgi:hypothetical protein